jgi:hypothetical protein
MQMRSQFRSLLLSALFCAACCGPLSASDYTLDRHTCGVTSYVKAKYGISESLTYQYAWGTPEYIGYQAINSGSNVDFASRYACTVGGGAGNFAEGQTNTYVSSDGASFATITVGQYSSAYTELFDYLPDYNDIDNEISYSSVDQYGEASVIYQLNSTTQTGYALIHGLLELDATYTGGADCIMDSVGVELGSEPDENGFPTVWTPYFGCSSTLGHGVYWSQMWWDFSDEELYQYYDVAYGSSGEESLDRNFYFYAPVGAYIKVYVKSATISDVVVDDDSVTWYRESDTTHNLSLTLTTP